MGREIETMRVLWVSFLFIGLASCLGDVQEASLDDTVTPIAEPPKMSVDSRIHNAKLAVAEATQALRLETQNHGSSTQSAPNFLPALQARANAQHDVKVLEQAKKEQEQAKRNNQPVPKMKHTKQQQELEKIHKKMQKVKAESKQVKKQENAELNALMNQQTVPSTGLSLTPQALAAVEAKVAHDVEAKVEAKVMSSLEKKSQQDTAVKPEAKKAAAVTPEAKKAAAATPEAKKAAAVKPEAKKAAAVKPEAKKAAAAKPEVKKPLDSTMVDKLQDEITADTKSTQKRFAAQMQQVNAHAKAAAAEPEAKKAAAVKPEAKKAAPVKPEAKKAAAAKPEAKKAAPVKPEAKKAAAAVSGSA